MKKVFIQKTIAPSYLRICPTAICSLHVLHARLQRQ